MNNELEKLLNECRLELASIDGLKAFGAYYDGVGSVEVLDCDIIDLDYTDLIYRIEKVISDDVKNSSH